MRWDPMGHKWCVVTSCISLLLLSGILYGQGGGFYNPGAPAVLPSSAYGRARLIDADAAGDLTGQGWSVWMQSLKATADADHLRPSLSLGWYNVKDHPYHAVGNDSANDTAAIQAAINAAGAAGGGIVYMPPGIYRFTVLAISDPNVTLVGAGRASTILRTTTNPAVNTAPIVWVKANDVALSDYRIDWVTPPAALIAPSLNSITNDNTIAVGWAEIAGGQTLIRNTRIERVWVAGGKQHGMGIGRSWGVTVRDCIIDRVYATGIWTYYASNLHIVNNRVQDTSDAAIDVISNGPDAFGPDDYAYDVVIQGNTLTHTNSVALCVHGSYQLAVVGNDVNDAWGGGIKLDEDPAGGHVRAARVTVTGNTVHGAFAWYGVGHMRAAHVQATVGGTWGAILVDIDGPVVLSNNTVSDDDATLSPYNSIWVEHAQAGTVLSNNVIQTTYGAGIRLGAGSATKDDVNDVSVVGNVIRPNANGSTAFICYGVRHGNFVGNSVAVNTAGTGSVLTVYRSLDLRFTSNKFRRYTTLVTDVSPGESADILIGANQNEIASGPIQTAVPIVVYGSTAPAGGTYTQGAICWNTAPTLGAPSGWACVAGGSPGTWHSIGAVGGGYTLHVQALTSSPVDAQTIYFGQLPAAPVTAAAQSKIYIRRPGTLKIAEIYCYSGTAGTNENWSLYIRTNNTTDTLIATVGAATQERVFTNTALAIPVAAGDYIEIKAVNPTWGTNPLTTIFGGNLYIE